MYHPGRFATLSTLKNNLKIKVRDIIEFAMTVNRFKYTLHVVLMLVHAYSLEQGGVQYRSVFAVLLRILSSKRVARLSAIYIYVTARLATHPIVINLRSPI